eukprot:Protomagalhaensia_wolfi_Nauph_80__2608@NODE_2754_length_998_cov_8_120959_g2159_i0_p1_GENE_NODE_2754_length_998_cov_8_120959_g2159_i0NODE_2754_length_998_cov_8_120959_g2159_i0_p1_ORF_typecomplete_len211_score61_69DUF812/PF05667_11/0_0059DUF4953/PF16313_5/0_38AAA_15/PF13175_6/0_43CFAP91/PF14738_6/2_9Ax_dynein_light/PF10211_9/7Ax_dynein_light/PF10211_9/28DUF3584/PF12128_8/6_4Phlebovirus_NSM/PF07246_11/7_3AAA_13/PF13166_6/10_NODE_2754_length_998_cov_8_120959_g2159_i0365964
MPRAPRRSRKAPRRGGPYEEVSMVEPDAGPLADEPVAIEEQKSAAERYRGAAVAATEKLDVTSKLEAMAEELASGKLSKKAKRRLEIAKLKEELEARAAAEEASLPPLEKTKSQLKRRHAQEMREVKREIAVLKKKRAKLSKKNLAQRESKKKINKEIKEILANIRAKQQADWKMIGADEEAEAAAKQVEMVDTDVGED